MLGFERVFQAEGMASTKAKAGVTGGGGGCSGVRRWVRDTKGHIV